MKKIYIREDSLKSLNKQRLLPKFIFKAVKNHTTSLGDSEAFPNGDGFPFDYTILKTRYNEVCDNVESLGLERIDEEYLMSRLSSLIRECKEAEKPIRHELERICENAVNRLFAIPKEMINLKCKLVDKVTFKKGVRITPESDAEPTYTFKDLDDIEHSNKVIEKRRFINALIQGAAYTYARHEDLYENDINSINPSLVPLYRKIIAINDYLLFVKKEEVSDEKPMQGSYAEVELGMQENKSSVEVQGIIFPLLLQETIKGLFDLFSAHGLPNDIQKAQYVIKKADYILAEPWDMRLGVGIWNKLFGKIDDTNIIPYVFTMYIKIPTDKFNIFTKEILFGTEKGHEILHSIIDKSTYDSGYEAFTNRINAKNISKAVINDSYFTASELNGFELDGDEPQDGGVIEEDETENEDNSVYTFYRGINGTRDLTDFRIDAKYYRTWLADNPYYAAEYAAEYEDGHLYEVKVDFSRYKEYDWYNQEDNFFEPIEGFSREDQEKLMQQGYNGYTFALDEGNVLVLFDPSLIVGVKELPLQEYLDDYEMNESAIKENTNVESSYAQLLVNATENEITFQNNGASRYGSFTYSTIVNVKGVQIPREIVAIEIQIVPLRISETDTLKLPQVHIVLNENIRGKGLGTKLYKALINQFGGIYSSGGRRINDESISAIYQRLSNEPNIDVYWIDNDEVKDREGNNTKDYIAIKNYERE